MVLRGEYKSGTDLWHQAPVALKRLLDFLGAAVLAKMAIHVRIPEAVPFNVRENLDDFEGLDFDTLRKKTRICWPVNNTTK